MAMISHETAPVEKKKKEESSSSSSLPASKSNFVEAEARSHRYAMAKSIQQQKHLRGEQRKISSSSKLRSDLLRKLGINDQKTRTMIQNASTMSEKSLLDHVILSEPLKSDNKNNNNNNNNKNKNNNNNAAKLENDLGTPWKRNSFSAVVTNFNSTTTTTAAVHSSLKMMPLADSANSSISSSSSSTSQEDSSSSSSSSSSSVPKERKQLTFHENVKVMPIPMRTEYSDRMKERLWTPAIELHENAHRNSVEFAAEGWDWRTVTEDDGMYTCSISGEKIHPVHCQQLHYYYY